MNFRQIQLINQFEREIPELRELIEKKYARIFEEINAINERINAIQSKKGATPGVLQLKKRVESLEDAVRQRNPQYLRSGTD